MESNKLLIGLQFNDNQGASIVMELIVLRDITLKQLLDGIKYGLMKKSGSSEVYKVCESIYAECLRSCDPVTGIFPKLTLTSHNDALISDFEDIRIVSYVTKDKAFSIEIDGVEITGSDLESKLDDKKINQVDMYDITIKNSYIAQNFSEDTVDTDLTLNAVAKNGDTAQVITLGHIYIDNVKPMGEYEKALQDMKFFGGFYGVDSKTLMIEGVSPDIDLSRCEIMVNDKSLTYANGGFVYDEGAHTISFTITKGYTNIRPTLVDNAGNVNNLSMIKKVYVGNLFVRFWYLFIIGGLIIISFPTLIALAIIRRKQTKKLS